MLLDLIAKEVTVLKKKVISTLYVFTEQSYNMAESNNQTTRSQAVASGQKEFYTTRVSLQLLAVLGES